MPSLSGVSSVDVVQTGKNLLPNKTYQRTANILRLGTDTLDGRLSLKAGMYTLSITSDVAIGSLTYTIGETSTNITFTSSGTRYYGSFTLSADTDDIFLHVYKSGGITSENVSDIMLEVGNTVSTYEAYEAPTTHTATLGRTIYGGSVDVVNGTGTDEWSEPFTFTGAESENWLWGQNGGYYRANITIQNIAYTVGARSECFCNLGTYKASGNDYNACFIYGNPTSAQFFFYPPQGIESLADFKTWLSSNNLKMTAPKATPEDFTFTPVPIDSRLGDNTMWSDGDLSVVYRSSGTQTLIPPTLISKTITENGTYSAAADAADGFSSVVVDVPTGATNIETVLGSSPLIEVTGVSGTDVTRTMWTRTAAAAETVVFHPNTQVKTNTGANDGYFKVLKNDVVVVSTYANTSTTTSFSIPDIDLEAGDVLTISVGFDNYHTSCWFDLYSTITILSSGSAPVLGLGLGNPGPVNESEEEPDAAPEEIQEETPEEVDQNESDE